MLTLREGYSDSVTLMVLKAWTEMGQPRIPSEEAASKYLQGREWLMVGYDGTLPAGAIWGLGEGQWHVGLLRAYHRHWAHPVLINQFFDWYWDRYDRIETVVGHGQTALLLQRVGAEAAPGGKMVLNRADFRPLRRRAHA